LQTPVERLGFAALVIQPPLHQFTAGLVHPVNLLVACVKITSYNQPAAAGSGLLSSEPWSSHSNQVYSAQGADNVI
jgi:hypothetical protein